MALGHLFIRVKKVVQKLLAVLGHDPGTLESYDPFFFSGTHKTEVVLLVFL